MSNGKPAGAPNQRISLADYDRMVLAYFDKQTVQHVAQTVGINERTARKYIERGDPSRGLPSIRRRFDDFRRGYLARQEEVASDRLDKKLRQARALGDGLFVSLFDQETSTIANPKVATPKQWAIITKAELELTAMKELRDAHNAQVDTVHRVDFADPGHRELMKAEIRVLLTRSIIAVAKEFMMALDPSGTARLVDRLPPHLRALIESPIDEPDIGVGQEILARATDGV